MSKPELVEVRLPAGTVIRVPAEQAARYSKPEPEPERKPQPKRRPRKRTES